MQQKHGVKCNLAVANDFLSVSRILLMFFLFNLIVCVYFSLQNFHAKFEQLFTFEDFHRNIRLVCKCFI